MGATRWEGERPDPVAGLTALEALELGLVQRVSPRFTCGSYSPESDSPCELEPGHEHAHHAHIDRTVRASWA